MSSSLDVDLTNNKHNKGQTTRKILGKGGVVLQAFFDINWSFPLGSYFMLAFFESFFTSHKCPPHFLMVCPQVQNDDYILNKEQVFLFKV